LREPPARPQGKGKKKEPCLWGPRAPVAERLGGAGKPKVRPEEAKRKSNREKGLFASWGGGTDRLKKRGLPRCGNRSGGQAGISKKRGGLPKGREKKKKEKRKGYGARKLRVIQKLTLFKSPENGGGMRSACRAGSTWKGKKRMTTGGGT